VLDRTRLAKVLAMTTSPHEGEALAAIRRANEIIQGEGLSWEQVLAQVSGRASHIVLQNEPYMPEDDWHMYIRVKRFT
jgi:hypothetical protein